mmetsp:Transcript_992/g.1184  ORF Transcript_992/g.1184 Transcript_992/m.1184 type:complete len:336 (-) Transcript_992:221-1228(-)
MSDYDTDTSVPLSTTRKRSSRASALRSASKTKLLAKDNTGSDSEDGLDLLSLKSSSLSSGSESDWDSAKPKKKTEIVKKTVKKTVRKTVKKAVNKIGAKLKGRSIGKTVGKPKKTKSESSEAVKIDLPKKKKLKIDEEAKLIQEKAIKTAKERQLLSGEFEAVNKDEGSILPPALLRCNMTELSVKKKARKEQRFLFIFPGKLAILNEGFCGSLENISTNSPVLNIDFGQEKTAESPGSSSKAAVKRPSFKRLRLMGNIVYPKNDYMTINCHANGKQVICEDTFDHMVVFHSYEWLLVENGEEKIIPLQDVEDAEGISKETEIDWNDPPVASDPA